MDAKGVIGWVEAHPVEATVIGAGGVIALLWLLGAFGSSSSSNNGASNMAAAYYAAEQAQAVVGGQIQTATINAAAATAINQAQVNGAVAINSAQTGAATTINGQNANAAQAINLGLGSDALLATQSNNATALATTQSNNATASAIATSNNNASMFNNLVSTIFPVELTQGPDAALASPFGTIWATESAMGFGTPNTMAAAGYTPTQIARAAGGP